MTTGDQEPWRVTLCSHDGPGRSVSCLARQEKKEKKARDKLMFSVVASCPAGAVCLTCACQRQPRAGVLGSGMLFLFDTRLRRYLNILLVLSTGIYWYIYWYICWYSVIFTGIYGGLLTNRPLPQVIPPMTRRPRFTRPVSLGFTASVYQPTS